MTHRVAEPTVHAERIDADRFRCRAEQAVLRVGCHRDSQVVEVFTSVWVGALDPASTGALEDVGAVARAWAERLNGVSLQ